VPQCGDWCMRWCVCWSVLKCVTVYWTVTVWCSELQYVAVCCSVLQCVAVCCSVLQCGAVWCSELQYVVVTRKSWMFDRVSFCLLISHYLQSSTAETDLQRSVCKQTNKDKCFYGSWDDRSCKFLSANQPLHIGLICGKPMKIRHLWVLASCTNICYTYDLTYCMKW